MANFLSNALGLVLGHICVSDVAIAMSGLFIISCVIERLTNKGPVLWPVLGIIPTLMVNLNHAHDWVTNKLIATGGTFAYRGMWLGGAHGILTVDPSKIEYMLRTNSKNFPKGKYYRERFNDLLGDGIFNADDVSWQRQRHVANAEMRSNRFSRYSLRAVRDLVTNKLLKLTDKLSVSDEIVDLQELLLRFTFDNICTAALGVDSGCLDIDLPDVPFAKAFEAATELTLYRFIAPPFVWKPMRSLGFGFEKRLKHATEFVREFADKVVKERRREMIENNDGLNDRCDLLSRLMVLEERFSDKFLSDFCISFILAGRDTSSVGLAWFFWLVQKNPDIEDKILCELREILSSRRDKDEDVDREIFSAEELKRMVYLQAALTEAMRLYPPVPVDIKEVVNDDVFPDGTAVKCGARVLYSMYSMARMEWIWGRDCLEFRPERWVEPESGRFAAESQFKYAVFNGGPRLCLGKSFAYIQMKMVAASILLRYEVRVLEGQRIVPKVTTTLYMKNGLLVSFKRR